jgi:hypothetical protein
MYRKILAVTLAIALGGTALAQTASSTTTQQTGISKPPPGTSPPSSRRINHSANPSVLGNNTPTIPQIALHPTATIGSPVPIAGPGGTTRSPTGY